MLVVNFIFNISRELIEQEQKVFIFQRMENN